MEDKNFATKYRPITYADVVGQEIPKSVLKKIALSPGIACRSIFLKGSWGSGKCVLGETRVATSKGYLPIKSIFNGNDGFNEYVTDVYTRYGVRKSSHWFKQRDCIVIKHKLANGFTINGTADHRVLAYHNNCVDLHRLGDLSVGDIILFPKTPIGYTWTHIPELAYATGLWLGDGYTHDGTMGFCGTKEMCEKFAKLVGWSGSLTQDKRREDLYTVRQLKGDNSLINLSGHSNDKEIPEYIFCSDVESRIAFIQGLLETDGSISAKNDVEWTMCSEKLIKQLQELLFTLGVSAHLTSKITTCAEYTGIAWRLRIPASQSNFTLSKNGRTWSHRDSMNDRNIIRVDGQFICDVIRRHRVGFVNRHKSDVGAKLSSNVRTWSAITERSLIKYKEFYGELPHELEGLIGYNYEPIVDTSFVNDDVYDLTVPEVHEFYCQGTYNHNTTLARIFAKSMNCEHFAETGDVCNSCDACKDVMVKNSQLYMEFDATTAGNVDSIRALHDKLSYLPPKGGRRVVVLDEVHACVDCRTPIMTTKGAIEAKKLVDGKIQRSVKSYNYHTGKVEERPITAHYNNGYCEGVKWYRCQWNGGVARVTENHEFFVNGNTVQVRNLPDVFYADCIDYKIPADVEQIIIGTLLGDSTLVSHDIITKDTVRSRALRRVEKTFAIQMSQGLDKLEYLRWKEHVLGPLFSKEVIKRKTTGKDVFSAITKTSSSFAKYAGLHNSRDSYKDIVSYLPMFGRWTWLVWYLDDGNLSKDGIVNISCTDIGVHGADAVIEFAKTLGWDVRKSVTTDKRSAKQQIRLYWTKESSKNFLEYVSGLIDVECIKYKIPNSVGSTAVQEVKEDLIPCGRKVVKSEFTPINQKRSVRYNISVEETENYTLPGGLLTHNCSSSALNALLKLVEEGIPSTIFVFCSTEDILPTLKSRSICLDVTTIPPVLMSERIKEVANQEGISISESDIHTICAKSLGHMRDALSLLQLYSLAGSEVLKTPTELLYKFIIAALKKNRPIALSLIPEIMSYPTTDISASLSGLIRSIYTSAPESQMNLLLKNGMVNKLFIFFYTPVAQQALRSEVGTELLLRSFLEKTNPHG